MKLYLQNAFLTLLTLLLIVPAYSFELKVGDAEKLKNEKPIMVASATFASSLASGGSNVPPRAVRRVEKQITVDGASFRYLATGALRGGSNMTVIFLHGRGGDRRLGFSDHRFDGNFKLVKDLMYDNGGIYISTDVTNFNENGRKNIGSLISYYRKKTTGKIVVACGSMGSFVCWHLAKYKKTARMIDAYIFLGGFPDPEFLSSGKLEVLENKPPIYFSHGSKDKVYDWRYANRYSRALRRRYSNYPVKLALIRGGNHGDPIKKINWLNALSWISKH